MIKSCQEPGTRVLTPFGTARIEEYGFVLDYRGFQQKVRYDDGVIELCPEKDITVIAKR